MGIERNQSIHKTCATAVSAVLCVIAAFPSAAVSEVRPLDVAAKQLWSQPWSAQIEALVRRAERGVDASAEDRLRSEADGLLIDNDDKTVSEGRLSVWYDPEGAVRLALGSIRVEAREGRLIAVHANNPGAIYQAVDPGATIGDLLARELPPLWCPWLAIALERDPGAWPLVGHGGQKRIEWTFELRAGGGGIVVPHPYSGRCEQARGSFELEVQTRTFWEEADPADLHEYWLLIGDDTSRTEMLFQRRIDPPLPWLDIDTKSRVMVLSIAALSPPPPELGFGDRFPSLSLTCVSDADLSIGAYRPTDVFDVKEPHRRPDAFVMIVVRPTERAAEVLIRAAHTIERTHEGGYAIARPVIATKTRDVELDRLLPLRDAWRSAFHDESLWLVESKTHDLAWLPATLLLDRVAPGADAAIVIIDRSGWIVGVHPPDESPEAIAESIEAAAR